MANVKKSAGGMAGRNIIGMATYVPAKTAEESKDGKAHNAYMSVVARLDARDPKVQKVKDGNLYLTNKPRELTAEQVAAMPEGRQPKANKDGKYFTTNHIENYSLSDWQAIMSKGQIQPIADSKDGQARYLFQAKADLRVVKDKDSAAKRLKFDGVSVGQSDFSDQPLTEEELNKQAAQAQAWRNEEIEAARQVRDFQANNGRLAPAPQAPTPAPEAESEGDFEPC